MSEQATLNSWKIPSSEGIGVDYYYKDILRPSQADVDRGASYTQNFIREHIARCDSQLHPIQNSIYDEGQSTRMHDRPQMSWSGLFGILEDAGVSKEIIDQIDPYLSHLAYKRGDPMDFLVVKEFLAYCGIDGVYDLEQRKHFSVIPLVDMIPISVLQTAWNSKESGEEVRLQVAKLMDRSDSMTRYDAEMRTLNSTIWGEYANILIADLTAGREVDDVPHRQNYVDTHPELAGPIARYDELDAAKEKAIHEMKNRYAPLDKSFKLPTLGIEHDFNWHQKADKALLRRIFFKDKLQDYHKKNNLKVGDVGHIPFDWSAVKVRAFAMSDWSLRDFTMSPVNKGVISEYRRHDIPRNFVKAVLKEKEDGLLGILETVYRIEFIDDERNKFCIIFNDTVVEASSIDEVLELKAKNEIEDAALAKENSLLVKRYEIPPVEDTVREEIPIVYTIANNRPNMPKIVYMTPDFDDLDEFERAMRLAAKEKTDQAELQMPTDPKTTEDPNSEPDSIFDEADISDVTTTTSDMAHEHIEASKNDVVNENRPSDVATLTGEDNDLPSPALLTDKPIVVEPDPEPKKEPGVEVNPKFTFRRTMVDEGGETLPFPDSPVGSEDRKPDINKDDVAIEFDVTRVMDRLFLKDKEPSRNAPHSNKAADVPTQAKAESPVKVKLGKPSADPKPKAAPAISKPNPNAQASGLKTDFGKQKGKTSGEEALKRLMEAEKSKAMEAQSNSGKGGGGGMGGMGRDHSPATYTVDLGFNSLLSGLGKLGSGIAKTLSGSPSEAKMSSSQRADWLSMNADKLSEARRFLEAGTGENGQPLSITEQEKGWKTLKSAIEGIDKATSGISQSKLGHITDDLMKSFKNAVNEVKATKGLVDDSAKKPGKIGEMARDAQLSLQKLTQALEMLIKLIMRAFGKSSDKDNAPSP